MNELLKRVLKHEGFRSKPYTDSLGVITIGHGLTYITESESIDIVEERLLELRRKIWGAHPWLNDRWALTDVLAEMCFQLGWTGCHNFKRMWKALEKADMNEAADEALNSRWAKQTPARALELSELMRNA